MRHLAPEATAGAPLSIGFGARSTGKELKCGWQRLGVDAEAGGAVAR